MAARDRFFALVAAFLAAGSVATAVVKNTRRKLAAILAADVVGYSRVRGVSPEMRVLT